MKRSFLLSSGLHKLVKWHKLSFKFFMEFNIFGFFLFSVFRLDWFWPKLYWLNGFIFCLLMSDKNLCVLVCFEAEGHLISFH